MRGEIGFGYDNRVEGLHWVNFLKQQWPTELLSLGERSLKGWENIDHFEVGLNKGSKIKMAHL